MKRDENNLAFPRQSDTAAAKIFSASHSCNVPRALSMPSYLAFEGCIRSCYGKETNEEREQKEEEEGPVMRMTV